MFKKFLDKQIFMDTHEDNTLLGELQLNKEELDACLNSDSLTIKCRIWKVDDEVLISRKCYARTLNDIEKITYNCTLEGFGEDLETGESRLLKRLIILSDVPFFSMDVSLTRSKNLDSNILIEIKQTEPLKKNLLSACDIFLIDAAGEIAHSVEDCVEFKESGQVWTFPFVQVSKLLSNKKLYLPNGTLSLRCEFIVSSSATYNKVERTEIGTMNNNQRLQCFNQTSSESNFLGSLKNNLNRFYEEGRFSDVTIRTPRKEFPVHKTILCARSEVFSTIFERDTKENQTCVIEIEDIDDDTVSKMLRFLYTDTIGEDLEFVMASRLYFAADKYRIMALKTKCSDFLKDNFTVTNICDVLVFSDINQDEEMKSIAQEFVLEHSIEIMKSEEWANLMQNQVKLTSEIMAALIQNLKI